MLRKRENSTMLETQSISLEKGYMCNDVSWRVSKEIHFMMPYRSEPESTVTESEQEMEQHGTRNMCNRLRIFKEWFVRHNQGFLKKWKIRYFFFSSNVCYLLKFRPMNKFCEISIFCIFRLKNVVFPKNPNNFFYPILNAYFYTEQFQKTLTQRIREYLLIWDQKWPIYTTMIFFFKIQNIHFYSH